MRIWAPARGGGMENRGHTEKEAKPCIWARRGEAASSMEIFSDKVNWKSNRLTLPQRQLESCLSQLLNVMGVGKVCLENLLPWVYLSLYYRLLKGISPSWEINVKAPLKNKVTEQRRDSTRTNHIEQTADWEPQERQTKGSLEGASKYVKNGDTKESKIQRNETGEIRL